MPAARSAPQQKAQRRTWLITSCSSGIGKTVCQRVLEGGDRVVCIARDDGRLADLISDFPDRALALRLSTSYEASGNS